MGKIFVTSDLHFCHNKMFIYEARGFTDIYEHNIYIVKAWNKMINPDDDVYILGDLMLMDDVEGMRLLKQLNGNLHIIRGNHDTDNRWELYNSLYNVVEMDCAKYLNYNGYHLFLSHYPCLCDNNDSDKSLKKRCINICGHRHTTDPFADFNNGLIFHCELDVNHCRPWNLDEIIELIKKRVGEEE